MCGETGSGKTTQPPKIAMTLGRGVAPASSATPSRVAAASPTASRIAQELKSRARRGRRLQDPLHRQDRRAQPRQADDRRHPAGRDPDRPAAAAYDTLIIDEAHERSLNIDFLLGYLKTLLPRPRI